MARFSLNKLPKEQRIQLIGEFYDAAASLKSREEIREFFRDLLNPDEIAMLMRRIEIAALLSAGFSCQKIQKLLRVGMATITSVHRKLQRERGGKGYRTVVSRLLEQRKKKLQARQKQVRIREQPFAQLKHRYPLPFLLFNVLDEIEANRERKSSKLTNQALSYTPSRKS